MRGDLKNLLHEFVRARQGATAMEFAILALPFFFVMMTVIEGTLIINTRAGLVHGLDNASRQIRTGKFQTETACSSNASLFVNELCALMPGGTGCGDKLHIEVLGSNNNRIDLSRLTRTSGESLTIPDSIYENTVGGQMVLVRARYYFDLILPGNMTTFANAGGNRHVIQELMAFRNELFPDRCS